MSIFDIISSILSSFSNQSQDVPSVPTKPSMNTIYLKRGPLTSAGIFGTITLSWDSWTGVSLENPAVVIPAGTFTMEWHVSPHLNNATVPMLQNVPGRTEILIHWGNVETCSEGCILCGLVQDGNAIDSTQTACQELYAKINAVGIQTVQIVITQ